MGIRHQQTVSRLREHVRDNPALRPELVQAGLAIFLALQEENLRRAMMQQRFVDDPPNIVRALTALQDPQDRSQICAFGGFPDPKLFPRRALRRACDAILRQEEKAGRALQYGQTDGNPEIREAVFSYAIPPEVREFYERFASALNSLDEKVGREAGLPLTQPWDCLVMCNGVQRLIDVMLGKISRGTIITMYPVYVALKGPRTDQVGEVIAVPFAPDHQGIDMEALRAKVDEIDKKSAAIIAARQTAIKRTQAKLDREIVAVGLYDEPLVDAYLEACQEYAQGNKKDAVEQARKTQRIHELEEQLLGKYHYLSREQLQPIQDAAMALINYERDIEQAQEAVVTTIFISPGNPDYHNWSKERFIELVKFAGEKGITVIYDGAYSEFNQEGRINPWNCGLADEDLAHVIYFGTFGKTLAPGLRMGYFLSTHPDVIQATVSALGKSDFCAAPFAASIVAELVNTDEGRVFLQHVEKVRQVYNKRSQAFAKIMRAILPDELKPMVQTTDLGIYNWLELIGIGDQPPPHAEAVTNILAAKPEQGGLNALILPGSALTTEGDPVSDHLLRVNISMNDTQTLQKLALRIAVALDGIYGLGQRDQIIERWRTQTRNRIPVEDFVLNWQLPPAAAQRPAQAKAQAA